MKIRITSLLLMSLVVTAPFDLFAQTKTTSSKKSAKSQVSKKTRSRRVDEASTTSGTSESTDSGVAPKPESSPVPSPAGNEKPATDSPASQPALPSVKVTMSASPAASPEVPVDPIAALRNQIEAATTGVERNRLHLKLVEELLSLGKKTEAISELHAIAAGDVFDPQGLFNVGNSCARLGDNDGAIEAYRKAIEQRNGGYSRALNNLGVVYLRVGRWDDSYNALISALKVESFRYPEASYNLGRLYAAQGQKDLAVREFRRVLALDPKHTAAADALARVGSEDRVVVQPNTKTSTRSGTEPTSSGTKLSTSSVLTPKSLALDRTSFDLLQQARSLTEKGNFRDSVDSYKRLLARQDGYFPPANLELSFALMSLKQYDEARSNLEMVADRDGARYPICYYHLARVNELQGDLKQAETLFSRAVTAFVPQNSQFLLDVSRVREKQGDFKGALEAMERYLTLMQEQGKEPSWSDERLTALKQKVAAAPKN